MRVTWRIAMEKMGLSLLWAVVLSGTALAQQVVTGTVTSRTGHPLPGVAVGVQGTSTRTFTDASGKFRVTAPSDAVLSFSLLGRRAVQQGVLGRTTIDVT